MNFVICGLPRSGTTIIARFVGGLPGVYVTHEPLQVWRKFGEWPLIPWKESIPIHHGIKEPFHTNHKIAQCCNESHLRMLQYFDFKFIWVTRDGDSWFKSISKWGVSFMEAVEMRREFEEFMGSAPAIEYEKFCADPIGVWNRLNPLGVIATEVNLATCGDPFMGDHKARASTEIFKQ